ncbi:hypothetical protein KM043_000024, partial [Ampulex compressa]
GSEKGGTRGHRVGRPSVAEAISRPALGKGPIEGARSRLAEAPGRRKVAESKSGAGKNRPYAAAAWPSRRHVEAVA